MKPKDSLPCPLDRILKYSIQLTPSQSNLNQLPEDGLVRPKHIVITCDFHGILK
jgi:hypothetical protein